jgi:NitT/TauT family transport system permease protein
MTKTQKRATMAKPPARHKMLERTSRPVSWGLGTAGILAVFVVWQLGYSSTIFVPPPAEVAGRFVELLGEADTWQSLGVSTRRLALGLLLGIAMGLLAAVVAGEREDLRRMMNVYVQIAFTLPSLLVGLMALVIFGISEFGVILAVAIIVFPFITAPVLEGVKSLDKSVLAMAQVYGVSRAHRLRDITLPHVAPFLFAGIRNGHALAWRVLIVTEIFSVRSGLGFKFERAFTLFQFDQLMVYLILMLAVIFAVEFLLLKPLEQRSSRWRTEGRRPVRTMASRFRLRGGNERIETNV